MSVLPAITSGREYRSADGCTGPYDQVPRIPPPVADWLASRKRPIMEEWMDRMRCLGPHYRDRPSRELRNTISRSFCANLETMKDGETDSVEDFVEFITALRLEAGFPLSEVQKAFDLFRIILLPMVLSSFCSQNAIPVLESMNRCVSYQIHRFSDRFQDLEQRAVLRHGALLESKIGGGLKEPAVNDRRFELLAEEINDGCFVVRDERIVFANRSFCDLHHTTPELALGENFFRFVAKEDRERLRSLCRELADAAPISRRMEYSRTVASGTSCATEMKAVAAELEQGPVIMGVCRDIKERRELENRMRSQESMAYVGRLAASLSHEIRNPLSAIKMNMQILSRKLDLEGFDRRRLEIMVSEVTRLETIIRRLMDLTAPIAPAFATVNLNSVVADCLDLLEPQLAETGIRVHKTLDRSGAEVKADKGMMEQVLINLLLNAMDAVGKQGCITVRTATEYRKTGTVRCVSVRDNGPGLTPEAMEKLFTPFFTQKSNGTGLGLANVKRILDAHHGHISVQSGAGRGARFTVRLTGA